MKSKPERARNPMWHAARRLKSALLCSCDGVGIKPNAAAARADSMMFTRSKTRWSARRIAEIFEQVPKLPARARFELWLYVERVGFQIYRRVPRVKGISTMKCKNCGKTFDPANRVTPSANEGALANVRYCSEECDRQFNNRKYYKQHKQNIVARVLKNQRRAQKGRLK